MSQFSSGKHAKLTADPEPFVDQWAIDRNPDGDPAGYDFDVRFSYEPRPEFDRPLTNPENGLLVRFRLVRSERDAVKAAPDWIKAIDLGHYKEYPKRVQKHARAVLTRLANLAQTEGAH